MDYLSEVKKAVERSQSCVAEHLETVPVKEVFLGKLSWEGAVEVFSLKDHPRAKKAYAWGAPNESRGGKIDFITVLEIPPIDSPQMAVKAAIAVQARNAAT